MSVTSFIPAIWYSKLLMQLTPRLVGENFVNHDTEGEVMYGGSVKINKIGTVTLKDYTGADIVYSDMDTTALTLNIDHKKYEAKQLDDVDAIQSRDGGQLIARYTEAMAIAIADDLDKETFKEIAGAATAGNTLGDDTTPVTVATSSAAKQLVLDLIAKADAANVPTEGRVLACGPAFKNLLLSDPYINISPAKADDTLRRGYVGDLYGVSVFWTNNIPKTTGENEQVLLSHPYFTTEVNQVQNMEALRLQNAFKDAVRCLSVSGRKTVYPEGVCKAVIDFS